MDTQVKLQDPFSYQILPIIVTGIIVAGYLVFLIIRKIVIMRKNADKYVKPVEDVRRELTPEEILQIKNEYILRLDKIEAGYNSGQTKMRVTYQMISATIREFVYRVTEIEVQNCTLSDIRQIGMPVLAELVEEYYRPEFEKESSGDVKSSIEKTKRAIERWS